MITYKYKIQNDIDIKQWLQPFNNVVRYAYNRFMENPDISIDDVIRIVQNDMNHIEILDFSLLRYAVLKASSLKGRDNVIFGSKKLFKAIKFFHQKKNPKLSLEELKLRFHNKRYNKPLFLRGCCKDSNGNRKAKLDIIDNNSIILKFNRSNHITVKLPILNTKHKKNLFHLQDLCDKNQGCFSIECNNEYIYIIFDEKYINSEKYYSSINNRILSLDLNPNYIGLSICDWRSGDSKKIIHKEIIDVFKINALKQNKYKRYKRNYETSEINRHIVDLVKYYKCELISFEKLDIEGKDHHRGKRYNKLVNNCWNRTKLLKNLIKRCNINNIKYQEIVAMYSSFIGQMMHINEYDSIAASLEISRRAYLYNKAIKNNVRPRNIVFPPFNVDIVPTRWKEMVTAKGIRCWKDLYLSLKKPKARYRFLFAVDKFNGISFSLNSCKSLVMIRFA